MIRTALAVVSFTAISNTAQKQYVATFGGTNGIEGTVTVDSREISVDIDLSGQPLLPGGFTECIADGLKWHIHEIWTHPDTTDRMGSDVCNGTYTSGHYDPWNACGSASANDHCNQSTSTSSTQCINVGDYNPDDNNPFSVEIGDWSSKYQLLSPDSDNKIFAEFSSFYEVLPSQLQGLSIVFHCNSGTRAFCAPFLESVITATDNTVKQDSTKIATAEFDVLSVDSVIIFYPNGNVSIDLDATNIMFSSATYGCSEFEYSIFEADGSLESSKLGIECDSVVGDQYDPTNQCLPWVSSVYCADGLLCADTTYSYVCDYDNDRYSCGPGDLSGKFGKWTNVGSDVLSKRETDDTLIPPTDDLIGRIVGVTCPKDDSSTKKFLACAVIKEYQEDDGVAHISFGMAFMVSFLALII